MGLFVTFSLACMCYEKHLFGKKSKSMQQTSAKSVIPISTNPDGIKI